MTTTNQSELDKHIPNSDGVCEECQRLDRFADKLNIVTWVFVGIVVAGVVVLRLFNLFGVQL